MKGGLGPLFHLVPFRAHDVVRAVTARLARDGGTLAIRYALAGEISRLRVPDKKTGGDLWQHTCFEAFIARDGMPAYHELNFSPAGEWAAYAFSRYREGARLPGAAIEPRIEVRHGEESLELDASLDLDRLGLRGTLRIGLSAVIEAADGGLSYWALRHAPGKPDFHYPDAFAARLE